MILLKRKLVYHVKKNDYSNNYSIEIQVFSAYFDSLTKSSSPQITFDILVFW